MNSLVIPVVMWGDKCPTHKVCTLTATRNWSHIITGCVDGQIVIWELNKEQSNVQPKTMLFGHSGAIVSIVPVTSKAPDATTKYFVSASSNNELCLWDLADGRCLEQTKLAATPTQLIPLEININGKLEPCIVCFGLFAEIFILSATGLNIISTLVSRIYPDWISSCCVVTSDGDTSIIGLTMSGTIKVWQLPHVIPGRTSPILEDESKQLRCRNAIQLEHLLHPVNLLLVVLPSEWQLYDGGDFSLLCTIEKVCHSPLTGGNFLSSSNKVLLWDQDGTVYVYQLPFTPNNQEHYRDNVRIHSNTTPNLLFSFSGKESGSLSFPPVFNLFEDSVISESLLLSGDSDGRVNVWCVMGNSRQKCNNPATMIASNSLQQFWECLGHKPAGIIDKITKGDFHNCVTTSLYLENLGQLACGREDGSIVLVPAAKTCKSHLLHDERASRKSGVPHRTLRGHSDRITCLLYPHQESTRYSAQVFVSGGADFSVILWEIFTGVQVHTFSIHGGDITQLLVPPDGCSPRIQQSVCSIAGDNSVAILSIKERKCVMLASRHTSTVSSIKWRPADDFMMVSCSDGALFVWQMETGHLDRYVTGLTAIEILDACSECQSARTDDVVQGTVNLSQAFKRRSLAGFKAAAQQGIKSILETLEDKLQEEEVEQSHANVVACSNALLVQPLRACPSQDYDSHVLFFNTETIIGTLLQEKALQRKMTRGQKRIENGDTTNPAKKVFNALIYQVKNQLLDSSDQASSALSSPTMQKKTNEREKRHRKHKSIEIDSVMNIAQLLLSCLHGWGLDKKLDDICKAQLRLCEPIVPVCFGLLSREGQTALMLPNWVRYCKSDIHVEVTVRNGCNHSYFSTKQTSRDQNQKKPIISHSGHWEISSSVTTQHLIGVISVANTLMELSSSGFSRPKPAAATTASDEVTNGGSTSSTMSETFNSNSSEVARVKQGWSLLATMHCVLLSELLNSPLYKPPRIELLARRWQDRCLEVREAAQALLLAKLRQLEPESRRRIVQDWAQHMPDYIQQQHIDLVPNTRSDELANVSGNAVHSHASTPVDDIGDKTSIASSELATEAPPQRPGLQKSSYESRRRQATAVIILGVIGSEFGQEMEPPRSNGSSPSKAGQSTSEVPDGFGLSNYSLARNTCKALVYLLLHPASARLPAHAPIRRAAIDLLGRGFTVWEPYIEVSAVLLGLLELCVDYNTHIASIQSGLPLSAKADSCRSSHHALCLIASARPLTFITTIAREVARHNAAAANPQHQALLATSIIVRSKAEILRIIELLAEKMMHDVMDLLVEVMDIILFCIDTTSLRTSHSLIDSMPALSRFHTISYDPRTRRIAIGTRQGAIYLYDLRTNKHQVISRGRSPISSLSFSPEGKYLSVYSLQENHLSFWMTSSSLFGMLQSQVKCVKTVRPLPPAVSQRLVAAPDHGRDFSKTALKLKWINNRITVLLLPDGTEYRCHV